MNILKTIVDTPNLSSSTSFKIIELLEKRGVESKETEYIYRKIINNEENEDYVLNYH